MTKKKPSAYKLLGLSATDGFTKKQLKRAYYEKARMHHPDRIHDDDPEKKAEKKAKATELFKKIKKAYEELAKKHFKCSKNVYEKSDDESDEEYLEQYIIKKKNRRTVHLNEFMPPKYKEKTVAPTERECACKEKKSKRKGKTEVDSDEERSLEAERRAEEQAIEMVGKDSLGWTSRTTSKKKACARGPAKLTDAHKLIAYCQKCEMWFVHGMRAYISHKFSARHIKWVREMKAAYRPLLFKSICGYPEDDGSLRISCDSCDKYFLSPEHFARHHQEIGKDIEQ